MIKFLFENLDHMLPIIACGLTAIAIMLERMKALFGDYPLKGASAFFERIRYLVLADRVGEAIALCDRYKGKPIVRVVKEGLMRAHQPEELVENGLEATVSEEIDRIKARTGFLSMLANVATLLGLIGTIFGLTASFEAVGSADAQQRSALLARGISAAMNHTLWGLTVAVPCMVVFSVLQNRTNRMKSELERAVVRTIDVLKQRYVATADHAPEKMKKGA